MAVLRFADLSYFTAGQWEEDLKFAREPILVDPKWENTILAESLLSQLDSLPSQEPNVFWMATSGSTGHPKLIRKTKDQISSEALYWKNNLESALGWKWVPSDRFQVTVPLCHLYGLIWGYELPRILGADIRYSSPSAIPEIEFLDSDVLIAIPYSLRLWMEKHIPLPKRIISSGSKFPVPLAQAFRAEGKVDIREIYGSTETGAMGFRNPMWKARFTLLPSVTPRLLSMKEEEVLLVRSEFVSEVAWELKPDTDKPSHWEETKLTDESGFFMTNDIGDYSEIGWNYFGRIDRLIKVKGKRISLDIVESLIASMPEVADVAVVSYADQEDTEIACMIRSNLSPFEIQKSLAKDLPASHLPKKMVLVEKIPKLPNGKTDYRSVMRGFT